jgi:thiol-disulfide isomerase/thioredoxin
MVLIFRLLLFFLFGFIFANSMQAQPKLYKLLTYPELERYLGEFQDTLVVVNFWSTWCRPCVEELPYFEEVNTQWKAKKVKVLLVSLDFLNEIESRLVPFLKKKELKSEVVVLNETDPNNWIDKVNPQWSGAIPATLLINRKGQKAAFEEKPFTRSELHKFIERYLKD